MTWRKWILPMLGLCAVLAGTGYWLWQRDSSPEVTAGNENGKPAAAFELKDSHGTVHRLEDLRGNVVFLHFWASWCPPCLDEIGPWVALGRDVAAQYPGKPVKFVAISLDKSWEDAQKILPEAELPKNLISLLDLANEVPDHFGTYQFPETYLIDPDLKIVAKWVGPQDWARPELKKVIEKLLERAPKPAA